MLTIVRICGTKTIAAYHVSLLNPGEDTYVSPIPWGGVYSVPLGGGVYSFLVGGDNKRVFPVVGTHRRFFYCGKSGNKTKCVCFLMFR